LCNQPKKQRASYKKLSKKETPPEIAGGFLLLPPPTQAVSKKNAMALTDWQHRLPMLLFYVHQKNFSAVIHKRKTAEILAVLGNRHKYSPLPTQPRPIFLLQNAKKTSIVLIDKLLFLIKPQPITGLHYSYKMKLRFFI